MHFLRMKQQFVKQRLQNTVKWWLPKNCELIGVAPGEVKSRARSTAKMKQSCALEPGDTGEKVLDAGKCLPKDLVTLAGVRGANQPVHTAAKVPLVILGTEIVR